MACELFCCRNCLMGLEFIILLAGSENECNLLSVSTGWVVRTRAWRWEVFLDPGEVRPAHLPFGWQDLQFWRLSILESPRYRAELVPALCSLQKRGFGVHSYLPWQHHIPHHWGLWQPSHRMSIKDPRLSSSSRLS